MPRILLPASDAKKIPEITHRISLPSIFDLPNFPLLAIDNLHQRGGMVPSDSTSSLKRKSPCDIDGAGHPKRHSSGDVFYGVPFALSRGDISQPPPPSSTHRDFNSTHQPLNSLALLSEIASTSRSGLVSAAEPSTRKHQFKHQIPARRASMPTVPNASEIRRMTSNRSPYLDETGNRSIAPKPHPDRDSAAGFDRLYHPDDFSRKRNPSIATAAPTSPNWRRRSPPSPTASDSSSSSSSIFAEDLSEKNRTGPSSPLLPIDGAIPPRTSHALAEQKRRMEINRIFEALRQVVTESNPKSHDVQTKARDAGKWEILTRAVECITELKRSESNCRRERDQLQAELAALSEKRKTNA